MDNDKKQRNNTVQVDDPTNADILALAAVTAKDLKIRKLSKSDYVERIIAEKKAEAVKAGKLEA